MSLVKKEINRVGPLIQYGQYLYKKVEIWTHPCTQGTPCEVEGRDLQVKGRQRLPSAVEQLGEAGDRFSLPAL